MLRIQKLRFDAKTEKFIGNEAANRFAKRQNVNEFFRRNRFELSNDNALGLSFGWSSAALGHAQPVEDVPWVRITAPTEFRIEAPA